MDEHDEEFLIYDWRAPICSIYYDFSPGPVHYETKEETIYGEMKLKRQYIIRNGQLNSVFDSGITIGDELLKEVLGNQASNQMKTIVASIQREQNQIIRNEKKVNILSSRALQGAEKPRLPYNGSLIYCIAILMTLPPIILCSSPLTRCLIAMSRLCFPNWARRICNKLPFKHI